VSRFQKIFLASAFVVVGFGVAKFLGQPILPTQLLNHSGASPVASAATQPAYVQPASANVGAAQTAGRIRLLPDSLTTHSGAPATNWDAAVPQPPRLGNTLAPVLLTNEKVDTLTAPRAFEFAPISSAPIAESETSRARLRNEAPRPIGIDPQSPAAIRRVPSETVEMADPYKIADTKAVPPIWSAPQLLNTGYNQGAASPPATLPASYAAPLNSVSEKQQVAPPPWPKQGEAPEPRTHIVVDGDSLERLASRYLSDPRRSREIYDFNREVLTAPDLLPIGAELKIPERLASVSWDRRGFPPDSANTPQNREVGRANVTTSRPVSTPQGIIPRAQLAPPVMVQ
jgi:nucleoid-associated protein YgaU